MKIGFLPLDTRPCTYDMPVQLARQARAEILLPPQGIMAHYKDESDTAALTVWLEQIASECDALVVSVEQLLYGGLIQSRQTLVGLEERMKRLQVLSRIKRKNPEIVIYLSNVLMRTSISTLDSETLVWWEKINNYSKLYYREKAKNDVDAAQKCRLLEQEIPADVLNTFFTARSINHAINRASIQLVADGIVEELFILQEDCAPEGVQRFEQEVLGKDIEQLGVSERVSMFNGTDEAGAELLQRAICPEGSELEIVWLGKQHDFVAKYEDRPFYENLEGHMKALSLREKKGAQSVLFVLTPKQNQREASFPRAEAKTDYTREELDLFSRKIEEHAKEGRHCYLLDLDFTNGGNSEMLACLAQVMPISELWGYSAWNTASNSLGTLLAQVLASKDGNDEKNQAFTAERILDDALYQELVRSAVKNRIEAEGEDIYNIHDISRTEQYLKEEFEVISPLLKTIFGKKIPSFEVKLRWPRLFEVAVFTDLGGGPVYGEKIACCS
ncbi:Uncharacterised protein [uncultured Clostridium sp.]